MPNIASVLKDEISRIARKEIRSETEGLKKAASTYRSEIAALKRRTQDLESQLRRLGKSKPNAAPAAAPEEGSPTLRFRAAGFASLRQRLGLSAEDCGRLLGASGQSVYNWEAGKAHPRAKHMPAIAVLRSMGKKEVAERLAALRQAS